MSKKINIEELKRENNFNVPANYFDSLEIQIQDRIKTPKKENFFFRFRYPSIALTLSTIAFSIWLLNKKEATPVVNTPAEIDYVSYINENIDEFDDDVIYDTYTPTSTIIVSAADQKKIEKTEALDEYLLDEGVDDELIIDEM